MEESKSVLEREWASIYSSKDAKFVLVGNVEGYKTRLEGSHVIAFNRTYARKESILVKKAKEGKTVFLGFDSALPNYSNMSNREVLFHVNLDEEEIITKENVDIALFRLTKSLKTFSTRKEKKIKSKDTLTQSSLTPLLFAPITAYLSCILTKNYLRSLVKTLFFSSSISSNSSPTLSNIPPTQNRL